MTSIGTIQVSVGCKWIAPQGDKLRYTLRFRARLTEIDDVRNPLIAPTVIGSREQHGCSKEHPR